MSSCVLLLLCLIYLLTLSIPQGPMLIFGHALAILSEQKGRTCLLHATETIYEIGSHSSYIYLMHQSFVTMPPPPTPPNPHPQVKVGDSEGKGMG